MDTEALAPAVLQLLRALGKAPKETHSIRLDPDGVTWHGMEGECVVTRRWAIRLDLRDMEWAALGYDV